MNIYVSNISFHTTEELLLQMFSHYGTVTGVKILKDTNTGLSRGFGFVEMQSQAAAMEAISQLDGKEIQGRSLRVSQAKGRFGFENNKGIAESNTKSVFR